MPNTSLSPCAELVRQRDPDRFITALFASGDDREALMTLYAFNAEIAAIRERVREPMAGMVRLQWWRDWLEAALLGQDREHHPVAVPLGRLIRERSLPLQPFEDCLTARELDIGATPPEDMAAVVDYARATGGQLSRLAATILRGGSASLEAAGRIGTAYALVGLARALPIHLSMGRLTVPASLSGEGNFTIAAKALCLEAERQLSDLKRQSHHRHVMPSLLPFVLTKRYIKNMRAAEWNPLSAGVVNRVRVPLSLTWAMIRRSVP